MERRIDHLQRRCQAQGDQEHHADRCLGGGRAYAHIRRRTEKDRELSQRRRGDHITRPGCEGRLRIQGMEQDGSRNGHHHGGLEDHDDSRCHAVSCVEGDSDVHRHLQDDSSEGREPSLWREGDHSRQCREQARFHIRGMVRDRERGCEIQARRHIQDHREREPLPGLEEDPRIHDHLSSEQRHQIAEVRL